MNSLKTAKSLWCLSWNPPLFPIFISHQCGSSRTARWHPEHSSSYPPGYRGYLPRRGRQVPAFLICPRHLLLMLNSWGIYLPFSAHPHSEMFPLLWLQCPWQYWGLSVNPVTPEATVSSPTPSTQFLKEGTLRRSTPLSSPTTWQP